MSKNSAGILLHTPPRSGPLRMLLVHPGGPFWRNRDKRAWSIPKGEYAPPECARSAALRELAEEIGVELGTSTQRGGKTITAWAAASEFDVNTLRSHHVEIEWPPKSGHIQRFPEVDRAEWCTPRIAHERVHSGQAVFVDRLLTHLGVD